GPDQGRDQARHSEDEGRDAGAPRIHHRKGDRRLPLPLIAAPPKTSPSAAPRERVVSRQGEPGEGPMKIADVIAVADRAGFFNRDLAAVKAGAKADGFAYPGKPVSPGFTRIVQPGTAISVMLVLEDGQVAFGDCMDVILSGVAGRDPLF